MTWIIIIGGSIIIILLIVGIVVSSSTERTLVEQRLGVYLDEDKQSVDREARRSVLTDWVSKRVEKTSYGDRIARELARADLKFKVAEYFVLIVICSLLLGLIAWFLGNRYPVSALIGGIAGAFAPRAYVIRQQKPRLQKFNDQLSAPISDEFRRVIQEMQIGIPMETALENLLRRIPSDDLDFVITAINVQREVGGNLSEILDNISFTIRERVRIKGEIRVLTSQVRISGTFLSLIPFFLTLVLWFLNPEYLLSVHQRGWICTGPII